MPFEHEAVKHSISEYVNSMAHTNGIESFWALLKRGYHGTYHHMSEKHLNRYVNEFAGRHNNRNADTIDQMAAITRGMAGKQLRYKDPCLSGCNPHPLYVGCAVIRQARVSEWKLMF